MLTTKADSQETTADCSSDDNLHSDLIAPRRLRVTLFPGSCCVDFEHVLASIADLDAVSGKRTSENQSHNIFIKVTVLQVRNVETLDD